MAIDTLSCPTCPERMRPVPNQPPPMFACPGCRAVWVGSSTLRKLSRAELPSLQVRDGSTTRACAQCQNTMLTSSMGPIEVEYCTGCDAVFFDMGELETLIPKSARPMSAPAASESTARPTTTPAGPKPAAAPGTMFLCAMCKTMHPRYQARQSHKGPVCPDCAPIAQKLARSGAISAPPPGAPSPSSGYDAGDLVDDLVTAEVVVDVIEVIGSIIGAFMNRD